MKFNKRNSEIGLRMIAAIFGGYLLTHLILIVLAALLPISRGESLLIVLMLGFVIYTLTILWAFSARSVLWCWLGLLTPSILLAFPVWLIIQPSAI